MSRSLGSAAGALAATGWLWGARALGRRRQAPDPGRSREELLRRLAPGASFIDVGGLWNAHGGIAFAAEEAGASPVVVYDAMDPTDEFERERERRSSPVRYVQGDLHEARSVEELGEFDVVWCTGVIYHSPNPYLQLEHLRRITAGHLVLGSVVIPELPGVEQACIWYPAMPEAMRRALARGHGDAGRLGVTAPFDPSPMMGYVNYWWGITPSALRAMLEVARFEIVEERRYSPFLLDLLARPVERPSVIPPPSFARERGKAREGGP